MSFLLSVDPGINACGVAEWDTQPRNVGDRLIPSRAYNIYSKHLAKSWDYRVAELIAKLDMITSGRSFKHVVTEFPEVFEGAKGNAAAKQGDVAHMAHFCGMLHAWALDRNCTFHVLEVTKWKGQLPKEIVETRLQRAIGSRDKCNKTISDHAWDAVGVGLVFSGCALDNHAVFGKSTAKKKRKS